MGPLMVDVQGESLSAEDKELLAHPLVGGIILFSRNYQDPRQIEELTKQIRLASENDILIAVDQEGGRVQRFRSGFSQLPAPAKFWSMANQKIEQAKVLAYQAGVLMALEVRSVGIDISFAPVLDVNGISDVIGDRAFHEQPDLVSELAGAYIKGMHYVGMKSTGKHFPGHGSVKEDSHIAMPVDKRTKQSIVDLDIQPFVQLNNEDLLDAVMPAHVIYPDVDEHSVGFSKLWLQQILRGEMQFNGVIFSDDLSMDGASSIGGYIERVEAAQEAGCDMLLLCNNRSAVETVLDGANIKVDVLSSQRIRGMLAHAAIPYEQLNSLPDWLKARKALSLGEIDNNT